MPVFLPGPPECDLGMQTLPGTLKGAANALSRNSLRYQHEERDTEGSSIVPGGPVD